MATAKCRDHPIFMIYKKKQLYFFLVEPQR